MGDDVLLDVVLEERGGREVQGEDCEGGCLGFDDSCVFEAEAVAGVCAGGDGLGFDSEGSLEDLLDQGGMGFGFAAS